MIYVRFANLCPDRIFLWLIAEEILETRLGEWK